jgi:NDP-sugar pyrophosphorylase family protein
MQAFILCGGFGTRFQQVSTDIPKSLAPINGVPFLEIQIRSLKKKGVTRFVLGTGHLAEKIEEHFGTGTKLGVEIRYSRETKPLGTAGAIKLAEPLLEETFLALNGDSYVEFDLPAMQRALTGHDALMVIALQKVADASRYGTVIVAGDNRVEGFREKAATRGEAFINAGVYLMRRRVLEGLLPDRAISIEKEVIPALVARGVWGVRCDGVFIDIGVPEDYVRAQSLLRPAGGTTSAR